MSRFVGCRLPLLNHIPGPSYAAELAQFFPAAVMLRKPGLFPLIDAGSRRRRVADL